ncbi:putative xenotropic and polytropic murine leukemia virus receptor pho1 [Tripterygium wilfordii]|uniref:Putative xenotropic and polytropic murine leukemia virus receptor pho1 n=1 Tax=Tripterygium wilfordii TaxID=458696 RepID=A0A7J7E275_TRIWF|nr:phosphate transporter PHO1-like [Tripterygium wilfordii]KAF5752406.1 putative xenotropic and polytropic murine leukemia virus receptor pho1 [Tripterygium wilfordii]
MVKFSKQLEAQLIPEWKDAFVNYWLLKKHIKKIKLSRIPKLSKQLNHDFTRSIFYTVRFFLSKKFVTSSDNNTTAAAAATAHVLQVTSKSMDSDDTEEDDEEQGCQTDRLQLLSEEDEVKGFLESLEDELNKVNQFYKTKEGEFVERGEILQKQLQILLDLKQILDQQPRKLIPGILPPSSPSSDFSESPRESIDQESTETDDIISTFEKNGLSFINSASTRTKTKKGKPKMAMRIDIPSTTPTRTIAALTSMLWEDLVNNPKKEGAGDIINRKKIQCAEKMIRGAFVELYRGLGLLKTYSSLNMVAFTKILKKFDKVANRQESASYLKVVKRSHFISSDKVVRLMDEVESIFTKHFANNDRKKTMKFLRPQQQKDSHMVTFFVGLFTGCFVSLFAVYAILAHLAGVFSPSSGITYMETVYPVFSVFALLSLHLFMYGCNLFMWNTMRINYNFIFEFQPSTALKYRDAFLICTTFMTSVVGSMVIHLLLRAHGFSPSHVDAIPGILLLIFLVLLVSPFNVLYRPTRYCFLRIIRNIVCSPFYKVLMVDFFMADQLTSQITLLRHLESTTCYFLAGSFKTHSYKTCNSTRLYRELAYVISFMPYYWRAMQCARRWFDENDSNHLANMGKYVSAMVAAGARITYSRQSDNLWFAIVLVTSVVATIYQLYWDFVKDWGILNTKSKNPWLRDDLVLKNKGIYYMSIAMNVVLRVVWVETITGFHFNMVESRLLDFFMASLEIIRRGHWNFYRLENEHLNNVGKFRAVKAVPLPFRETDSDG